MTAVWWRKPGQPRRTWTGADPEADLDSHQKREVTSGVDPGAQQPKGS